LSRLSIGSPPVGFHGRVAELPGLDDGADLVIAERHHLFGRPESAGWDYLNQPIWNPFEPCARYVAKATSMPKLQSNVTGRPVH
jgi:hypothetical protein